MSSQVSPHAFIEHWYGETLRDVAVARSGDATARAQLPLIEDRVRFYEWLTAEPLLTEAELVDALERTVRGEGPTVGIRIHGAVKGEAQRLLEEWRHPDRDVRHPYTF